MKKKSQKNLKIDMSREENGAKRKKAMENLYS